MTGNGHVPPDLAADLPAAPTVWFECCRGSARHTPRAPNFRYDLAVRKTTEEMRAGWDSVRCGGDDRGRTIRPSTVTAFLVPSRSRASTPTPSTPRTGWPSTRSASRWRQGRAAGREGCAGRGQGRAPIDDDSVVRAVSYVGCGRITKRTSRSHRRPGDPPACVSSHVGEIWVDSRARRSLLRAAGGHHADLPREGGRRAGRHQYLRTGDLGFLHDGELFITGSTRT